MGWLAQLGLLAIVIVAVFALFSLSSWVGRMRITVRDYEQGLLYASGRFVRLLEPGGHWLLPFQSAKVVDVRERVETVPNQEVLTKDRVAVKVSVLLRYRISDPARSEHSATLFAQALYADAQMALRDLVGGLDLDELMAGRPQLGGQLAATLVPKAAALGLTLESAGLKDLTFPPHLRQAFHQVVEAKQSALAALERARGESASLRHLANAARMLDNNPSLVTLKALHVTSAGPHTFVLGVPGAGAGVVGAGTAPSPEGTDQGATS
jgi:regulator of protease activity HflC (stomatin/prohibitin superfamily)